MISKEKVRHINALKSAKFRNRYGKFIAEGPKIIGELLKSPFKVLEIYATAEWIKMNDGKIPHHINLIEVQENELARISSQKTPNQVLAIVQIPDVPTKIPEIVNFVLMLDGISDPGNLGTIIRTADWFGIQHIICSENCVDIFNPKVVQATAGSIFRVPVYYTDLEQYIIQMTSMIDTYGAMLDGNNLYSVESGNSGIIIIGSESHGISKELLPFITHKIRIPDYSASKSFSAESLNASLATAVICAEFKRRQKTK
jgi:TrmH family RNA methyltransferase